MTNSLIILGLQFGDEGKGKITDYLGSAFDFGVRFNGANNAGHTVVVNDKKFPLSHLPASVLTNNPVMIAQGCSINPKVLLQEINMVKLHLGNFDLFLDPRCHVIMPYHQLLDQASEDYRSQKVGSLKLGVGFSYEDKTNRNGIRIVDLLDKTLLTTKLKEIWNFKIHRLERVYGVKTDLSIEPIVNEFAEYGRQLKPYILPVAEIVTENINKKKYLFESAQAFYLDYSFGTYPFTVAYNTLASSVYTGVGMPPSLIDVLGIVRAYTIRVGSGPLPTEQENEIGEKLREIGNEYGTVSKRPRRCGWLDLPLLKYAVKMNGVKEIALTKLDVLSHFEEIKVCTEYDYGESLTSAFVDLSNVKPIYSSLEGWQEDITNATKWGELPEKCQKYVEFIEQELGVHVRIISVGPNRHQTIQR